MSRLMLFVGGQKVGRLTARKSADIFSDDFVGRYI